MAILEVLPSVNRHFQTFFDFIFPLLSRCSHVSDLPVGFSVHPFALVQSSLEFPFSQGQTELRHQTNRGRISPCGAGRIVRHTLRHLSHIHIYGLLIWYTT